MKQKNMDFIKTHAAYDLGTLQVPDAQTGVKTKTTLCGSRVPVQMINNIAPNCPQCIYELSAMNDLTKDLFSELDEGPNE